MLWVTLIEIRAEWYTTMCGNWSQSHGCTPDVELPNLLWIQLDVPDVKFVNCGASRTPQHEGIPHQEPVASFLARSIAFTIISVHVTSIEISSDSLSRCPSKGYMDPLIRSPVHLWIIVFKTILPFHRYLNSLLGSKPDVVTWTC